MKTTNIGLRALTTSKERAELRAVGRMPRKPLILRYKGQMLWSKQYGIDSRLWDVLAPVLPTYDYRSGGYPTLTIDGLKERGLI
jgi:hypothetical protein